MTTTQPRLERIPLEKLTTGANVRIELRMNDELVKSIKANGIIQPPVVYPDPEVAGRYRILAGHRRAVAAQKAGLTDIEVIVRDAPGDAERVVDQLVENVHRDQLTDAEQASAYRQLSLDFGLPAVQIAKRTATTLARIGNAIKVASNPVASAILTQHQVTIEDALIFDEFAGDDDALEQLTATVTHRPEQLQHAAARIRQARAEGAARQIIVDEIADKGITLATDGGGGAESAARLRTEPGYGGTLVGLDTILAEAGEDLRAWPRKVGRWDGEGDDQRWVEEWVIQYGVANHKDHGWFTGDDKAATGALTDEQKDERRLARENGKLFAAATQVRREWVKTFLERRTMPADWATIPALVLVNLGSGFNYHARDRAEGFLALEQSGWTADGGGFRNTLLQLIEGNLAQAPHALLALAIAQLEVTWDEKQGWQTHTPTHVTYLRQLSTWGYTLAEIEEHVVNTALAGAGDEA